MLKLLLGKVSKLPFKPSACNSSVPFQLVHYDIWGLAPQSYVSHYLFYIIFMG